MTLTTASMSLDRAMVQPVNDPLTAVTEALTQHRWALAHLLVVKHVPAVGRSVFFDRLLDTVQDPLGHRMVSAVYGKVLGERAKEAWTVSPMAHVGYFCALAPHYARLVAMLALGAGDPSWTWEQRRSWLDEAIEQGLDLSVVGISRALVLEATRSPHPEVWGWLHAHRVLVPHAGLLGPALREQTNPFVPAVVAMLAGTGASLPAVPTP